MMTREEACLYLGISPDEVLDCDKIAECLRLKSSVYDLKRFESGTPEYIEANKMVAKIQEACDFLLTTCGKQYTSKNYNANTNSNSSNSNGFIPFGGIFVILISLFLVMFNSGGTEKSSQTNTPATISRSREISFPGDYSSLVERVMPSIVLIDTGPGRLASGFFVSPNGDILTNYHVIDSAEYITVTTQDGQNFSALIKDFDVARDIALLKVNNYYIAPYLGISREFPKTGERIISIGNPKGFQGTVSDGIVSAYRQDGNNNLWMQFTAPVSPGSSGGALFNLRGEVVGMTTMNYVEGQNLNFAVPCKVMEDFLSSAIYKPARAFTQPARKAPRKTATNTKKSSKGSGIPLPDAKGFIVHKWGCSVESIRRYVSSPLKEIGNTGTLFTTGKSFKAFNAKIDTIVIYSFNNNKLESIYFYIDDKHNKALLDSTIIRELTERYGAYQNDGYTNDGALVRTWYSPSLLISSRYNVGNNEIFVVFRPR